MKLYKKLYSTKLLLPIFVLILAVMSLYQCEDSIEKFAFGEKYIDSQTSINLLDTFSVDFSTVLLDTVESAGNGDILIGKFEDNIFGKIVSNSYFQIGAPNEFDADTIQDDVYESLELIIHYNGYFYGDSTIEQTFSVHQLLENIDLDDDSTITTNTKLQYNPVPLGTLTYLPKPNKEPDSLIIKLDDYFGEELFSLMKSDTAIFSDDDDFVDYFHGLVLVADNGQGIVGFNASSSDVRIVIQTSSRHSDEEKELKYIFPLYSQSLQFNNIVSDRSATNLASLFEQKTALPNENTDNSAFLQGGTGLAIRVDFPSIQNLLLLNIDVIQKVELTFAPLAGTYEDFDLPPTLLLYECDENNDILNSTEVSQSDLTIDELYNETTAYTFDITDYIAYYFSTSYFNPDYSLLMTLPSYYQASTFYRLITDNPKTDAKLKIYYLSY